MRLTLFITFFALVITFQVNAQCTVSINPSAPSICAGSSVTLIASNNAGTFTWSPSTGLNTTVGSTVVASPTTTTIYRVIKTCTNGLMDTAFVTITVNPLPTASFNSSPSQPCSNLPISFLSTSTGSGLTYAWNFGDPSSGGNNTSNLQNPSHVFNSAIGSSNQNFNVSLITTNNFGCIGSISQNISIKQRPDASIADYTSSTPFTNCIGGNFNLEVTNISSTTATNTSYTINWGDGTPNFNSSNWGLNATTSHTYNSLGYFTITLTVTGQNLCESTQTYTVYSGSNPAVGLGNPGGTVGICMPNSLTFPITGTSTNPPGTIYIVSTNTNSPSITYNHPPPSSYTHLFTETSCGATGASTPNAFYVRIRAENPCGFSVSTIEPITTSIKPSANFLISPDTIACVNNTITFTNTSTAGASVNAFGVCDSVTISNWTISPSLGWTITNGSLGNSNPSNNPSTWGSNSLGVQFSSPGTYNVSMLVRNSCGIDTITKVVCIQSPPTPSFTVNNNNGCIPLNVNTTNNLGTISNCTPPTLNWTVTYSATNCGTTASWSFTNGTNASSINPSFVFNNPGTYTITLSLTNKCGTFTTNRVVTVKKSPNVNLNVSPISSCSSPATTLPTATVTNCGTSPLTYLWSFPGGTPTSSTIPNPGNVSYTGVGSNTISVAVTNECGTTNANSTFTINPSPTIVAEPNLIFCPGNLVPANTFVSSPSGATFTWTNSNPAIGLAASGNSSIPSFNATNSSTSPIISTITVTPTFAGCIGTPINYTVTVNPSNTIATGVNRILCINSQMSVITLATIGATGVTFTGLPPGVTGVWLGNVATIAGTPTSIGIFNYTVTTLGGCPPAISSGTITVNPLPIVEAGPDISVCNQPIPITLSGFSPGLSSGGTGVWSGPNVSPTGVFTPNGTGNFTLTYTFTDVNGCVNSDSLIVSVINPIFADAGPDYQLCVNDGIVDLNSQQTPTPSGGTWSGPGVSGANFNPQIAGPGTHTLTYSVGSGTCATFDTILVIVYPLPSIVTSPNTAICIGSSTTLSANGGVSYSWSPATELNQTNISNPIASPTTTTTYTVTVIDNNACQNSSTLTITVNPLPIVEAGPNISVCNQPIPVTLSGFSPGLSSGGTGIWSGPNVSPTGVFTPNGTGNFTLTYTFTNLNNCVNSDSLIVTVINPTPANAGPDFNLCGNAGLVNLNTQQAPTPSGGTWSGPGVSGANFNPQIAGPGTHTLTYSVGSGTCASNDVVQVVVHPLPTIVTSPNTAICIGSSTTLSANGGVSYSWSPATGLNQTNISNPIASPTTTTTYTVTVIDNNACQNSSTVTITVNPLPIVEAGPNISVCNQPIPETLSGFSPSLSSGGSGVWSGPNVSPSGVFTPNGTGNFTLTYTFTNLNNCVNSDSLIVTVINPTPANAGPDFNLCGNAGLVNLNTQQAPTPSGGTWSGPGVSGANFNPQIAGPGTHTLTYSVGSGTCASNDVVQVVVHPLPTIVTSPNTAICIGSSTTLSANGGVSYSWSPATGLNQTNISNPIASPTTTTTYTVTVIDNNACQNSSTVTITVNPLPIVEAGPNISVCNQPIPETLSGFSPSLSSGGSGVWSGPNVSPSGVFTPNGTGNFTLTYTFTNLNNCVNSDSLIVTVINPTPANAGPDFNLCGNAGLVNLNTQQAPTPSGGTWSGPGVSGANFNPQIAGPGTHTLTYSVGSGTCASNDVVQVVVHPLPTIVTSPNTAICIGSSTTLSANGGVSYSWSPATGLNQTNISNPIASPTTTTTYTVTVIDNNACQNSSTVTITVNPLPIVEAGPNISVCNQPIPVTLSGFSPSLSSGGSGVWSGPNVSPSGVFTPNGTGNFTLTYTFTDVNGCVNSDSLIVSVINPIFADAGPDYQLCVNDGIVDLNSQQTPTPSGGTWSGPGVSGTNFNPQNVGAGTYSMVYCIGTGTCLNCDTTVYITNPIPNVNFENSLTCIGDSTFFTDLTSSNNASLEIWEWDFGDGVGSATLQNPSYLFNSVGSYSVNLSVLDNNSCSNDTTIDLIIHPLPSVIFSNPNVSCPDSIVLFILDTIDGVSYNWDFGDGSIGSGENPSHTYINSGNYTIQLIAENEFGCLDSSFGNIEIALSPDANFIVNPKIGCGPLEVVINYAPSNPSLAFDYVWDFGNGDPFLTNAIPPNPYVYEAATNGADTFYVITLWVQSPICQEIAIHRDTVWVLSSPLSNFSVNQSDGCSPLNVTFTNTTFSNIDSVIANYGDGFSETIIGLNEFSHVFINNDDFNIEYEVQLLSFNECGLDTSNLTISVFPNTVNAELDVYPLQSCPNTPFQIINNSVGQAYTYYDLGNNIISANNMDSIFQIEFNESGIYTIYQYIYSSDSCSFDSDSIQIIVLEDAVSMFEYEESEPECYGEIEIVFINNSINAQYANWTFGDGYTSSDFNPIHTFPSDGVFNVTLSTASSEGCLDTLDTEIVLEYAENGLFVPNAMSPDIGSDEVRKFQPKGTCLKQYEVSIYDTWGELIWRSNKLANDTPAEFWNGIHFETGKEMPQGVYVWEIDAIFLNDEVWKGKAYDNKLKNIGTITIIR
ncbi:MAG: PKD domain-containing protein [Chitinophagales bacterium]|nr:PKD domain-containing protein [Chitinophagales bacterium]